MATMVLETPFDPQALFTALNYVSNIFSASSWQNLLKLFFMIALINGIISVGIYHKADYFKQFLIALGFASVLSIPIGDTLAIKRSDTERIYTINNSKAPFVLVYTINTVNSVTKWFAQMAGASLNSPNYTGMYDAGIGSNANIIRNSMDTTFKDPKLKADMLQFIKECTLYDIRDGAVSMDALINNGNGFDLILNNTSPARFVSINSISGRSEVKTCQSAAIDLKAKLNNEAQIALTGKAANFFYNKDVAPLMVYSTAVQSSYQTQLNINNNVSQITKQNMFNHLLEVSGEDIGRLISDPVMAESAAIHMGTARAAKKAAFQQSIIAQLGKELLPAMSSWFAIIIIMLFPFVVLLFVVTQFNNMLQILVGYMGTLFWICCWQPIFAIINGLANWELGRQLAKTGAFRQDGIPYGYVHTVYDTLLNNHAMVGWMVILTPIIAGMVVYGTYRGFSHLGNSIFSSYQGSSSAVGNEMSDGNLSMGNTTIGNNSIANASQNTTSANKYHTSPLLNSGQFQINSAIGHDQTIFRNQEISVTNANDSILSEASKIVDVSSLISNNQGINSTFAFRTGTAFEESSFGNAENGRTITDEHSNITSQGYNKSVSTYNRTGQDSRQGEETAKGDRWGNDTTVIRDTTTAGIDTSTTGGDKTDYSRKETSNEVGLTSSIGSQGLLGKAASAIGVNLGAGYKGSVADGEAVNRTNSKNQSKVVSLTTGTLVHDQTGDYGSQSTISSNMSYNDNGKEINNSTYNSGETSDRKSTAYMDSFTQGHRAQLTDNKDASLSIDTNISTNKEDNFTEGVSFRVDLGLTDNKDLLAASLYQSNPESFSEIMSQKYGMESGQNAWEFYESLEGLEQRDARIFLQSYAIEQRKSEVIGKKPFNIPLPETHEDNEGLFKNQSPKIQQLGDAGLEQLTTSSNYSPKK